MRVLLPKRLSVVDFNYGPLFFLAGPDRGGDDWQRKCCGEIRKLIEKFHVAIPCHYPENNPLIHFRMDGTGNRFDCQLNWERHYLDMAGTNPEGCIIFWLPNESKVEPRPGGDYARDTRGEIGEWRGRMIANPNLHVVVGGEENFPGLDIIRRNFCSALGQKFPIYPTLAQTVAAALKMVTCKT